MIGEPPSLKGTNQNTNIEPFPEIAFKLCGGVGTFAGGLVGPLGDAEPEGVDVVGVAVGEVGVGVPAVGVVGLGVGVADVGVIGAGVVGAGGTGAGVVGATVGLTVGAGIVIGAEKLGEMVAAYLFCAGT